ncbi:hypothetical protein TRFO_39997 [Tritrichomonas foetus]|uniref:Uncharacterized protein n=1 Tax=Tritrichomonas foetus TaxID=1144522 RepID=A0A1J4J2P3_9EUKA|nr:hypothetical protein TRFO_39997 [Tritrichomonas foetus]|eukprot:OHS93712.1 hypothetical protein TRFO_39997 [Tritrichomonas foetus]
MDYPFSTRNINKYQDKLQDILRKVSNAAPLFQKQQNCAVNVIHQYNELNNEEEQLKRRKEREIEIRRNVMERCSIINEAYESSFERYRQIVSTVKDLVAKEAALAIKHGENPLIFSLTSFEGQTPLIMESRLKVRLISLKAKLREKMDLLNELRKNVYCLDSDDNVNNYQISEKSLNLPIEKSVNNHEQIRQGLKESLQFGVPRTALNAISKIVNPIQNSIRSYPVKNEIPLYVADFRRSQKCSDHPIQLSVSFEELSIFDSQMKDKINEIFQEIDQLYSERQNFLTSFYLSKQDDVRDMKILACINVLMNSSRVIRKAQNVLNILNSAIKTNLSIPFDVWSNENRIHLKMKQLLYSIDRLTDLLAKSQKYVKIGEFSYPELDEPIIVDEISRTQIQQCMELIFELQDELLQNEKDNSTAINEIGDLIEDFSKKRQENVEKDDDFETETKINANSFDSNSINSNAMNTGVTPELLTDDENLPDLLRYRDELLAKQNDELAKLMDLISSLPDDLREIDFENTNFELKPTQKLQLPPILDVEATKEAVLSKFNSNELSETNLKLIEQMKAKSFHLEKSVIPNQTLEIPHKVKKVKDEKLESIVDSLQTKLKCSVVVDQTASLVEKSHILADKQNELQYMIALSADKVKKLKKAVDEAQEKVAELEKVNSQLRKDLKTIPIIRNKKEENIQNLEQKKAELLEKIAINNKNKNRLTEIENELESIATEIKDLDEN